MIKTISYNKEDIGGLLKMSKQHFRWRLEIDGRLMTIELLSSKLSGRRRIYLDGKLIHERQIFEPVFNHMFQVGENHSIIVS